ncbi:type II toxin-antitoxin system VapC family toxin [Glycomyces albidus]|uniref:VapC toxin family PIN domain ribonuclease n=1 Tax=Glycomyces albidus TaxID=2656774 RepID=A0A6L5G745_9ACTN|nr:type II toxin-antitoxin system VapC family toxin [Glycomyces albidus]MQM25474.1 VapC toxin family PIN domain ribonuclease [Glycomyces albidus]
MTESRPVHEFGLLDTSAVIDFGKLPQEVLPTASAISAVTLAELYAGPHAARNEPVEQARRQQLLDWAQQSFRNPLPFDEASARVFGTVNLLALTAGRKPRKYTADLMIASIAIRNRLPLFTRNPEDFTPLESLLEVVAI